MQHVLRTANLGFPSIGTDRELKFAVEKFWRGELSETELLTQAAALRRKHWALQRDLGVDIIPAHDFTLYDRMLDMSVLFNVIPKRFADLPPGLGRYFAMARGAGERAPLEMTKWFSTNYHYSVPEIATDQSFSIEKNTVLEACLEARAAGFTTRPVIIGPLSFLLLSRVAGSDRLAPLSALVPLYGHLLATLSAAGVKEIQIDEPALALDQTPPVLTAYTEAYEKLRAAAPQLHITVATYFGKLADNIPTACTLAIDALHVDVCRAAEELPLILTTLAPHITLSCGIVDAHNVWAANIRECSALIDEAVTALGAARVVLAPSCSLLHVPWDAARETHLNTEVRSRLAFGREKLIELTQLADPKLRLQAASGTATLNTAPGKAATVPSADITERAPRSERRTAQQARLALPLLPTTTIGSLPQTKELRTQRAAFMNGALTAQAYDEFLRRRTAHAITWQEDIGLDVLVHGEFERNDMVEYFGERLSGFVTTNHGWVQSYGSRCVKPPILHGTVARPKPMTLEMSRYAQSLTKKPVKGMLTGPITILQWSFVRTDQPRSQTASELARALQQEVRDLCAAGFAIVQIDEPALREGLPLRKRQWPEYLNWATTAFRLAAVGAPADTQIHTHMCYADFEDIIDAIAALDVDVISLESARSNMQVVATVADAHPIYDVGPGVYDIHSPNIPTVPELEARIAQICRLLPLEQVWINPDCGLKTRTWEQCEAALRAMVSAAQSQRQILGQAALA